MANQFAPEALNEEISGETSLGNEFAQICASDMAVVDIALV